MQEFSSGMKTARSLFSLSMPVANKTFTATVSAQSTPRDHIVDKVIERLLSSTLTDIPDLANLETDIESDLCLDDIKTSAATEEIVKEIEQEAPELSLSLLASNIRKLNAR